MGTSNNAEALVERTLAGDAGAFRSLIEENGRLVKHIVFKMVSNEQDREDVCQEIFIKVYRNIGSFRFESKISTWIAKVAYNTCATYVERKKLSVIEDIVSQNNAIEYCVDDRPLPDRCAENSDMAERIRTEIAKLPARYGTIIALFHLDDLSYGEIGEIMDLPEGTVKSHLFRARRILRTHLMKKYKPEELWKPGI